MQLQAEGLRGFIQHRTSPTEKALCQLVKGCQIAMQNAAILANENTQLRIVNNKRKRKREAKKLFIATGAALTAAEAAATIKPLEIVDNELEGGEEAGPSQPKKHAPSKCSICKSEEHTARTCAQR